MQRGTGALFQAPEQSVGGGPQAIGAPPAALRLAAALAPPQQRAPSWPSEFTSHPDADFYRTLFSVCEKKAVVQAPSADHSGRSLAAATVGASATTGADLAPAMGADGARKRSPRGLGAAGLFIQSAGRSRGGQEEAEDDIGKSTAWGQFGGLKRANTAYLNLEATDVLSGKDLRVLEDTNVQGKLHQK